LDTQKCALRAVRERQRFFPRSFYILHHSVLHSVRARHATARTPHHAPCANLARFLRAKPSVTSMAATHGKIILLYHSFVKLLGYRLFKDERRRTVRCPPRNTCGTLRGSQGCCGSAANMKVSSHVYGVPTYTVHAKVAKTILFAISAEDASRSSGSFLFVHTRGLTVRRDTDWRGVADGAHLHTKPDKAAEQKLPLQQVKHLARQGSVLLPPRRLRGCFGTTSRAARPAGKEPTAAPAGNPRSQQLLPGPPPHCHHRPPIAAAPPSCPHPARQRSRCTRGSTPATNSRLLTKPRR
jgi:hypothetical protein